MRISIFAIFIFASLISFSQLPKWILGSSQSNSNGNFLPIAENQLHFYELSFDANLSVSNRITGNSINSILSMGTQDIMQTAVNTEGTVLFYTFSATTVPYASSGPSQPDVIYFAAYDITTNADEVFGSITSEGWASTVIESELVRNTTYDNLYYFIYKTKALSTSNDKIMYVTIDAINKTVSEASIIVEGEKSGEGFAVSQPRCASVNFRDETVRWLFTSRAEENGNITLRRSEITGSGIMNTMDLYTIDIPGNEIVVISTIEISAQSNLLAITNYNTTTTPKDVILFDFELESGAVNNERYYTNDAGYPIVTTEFSPDASHIFLMQGGSSSFPTTVYSCPVSSNNFNITNNYELDNLNLGLTIMMEVAIDGKLYINPGQSSNYFYVVDDPNSNNPAVSITSNTLFESGNYFGSGIPDHVDGEAYNVLPCAIDNVSLLAATELRVYPNPTSDYLNIELASKTGFTKLQLINAVGQNIAYKDLTFDGNTIKLYIGDSPPGQYHILCFFETGLLHGTMIVED